MLHPSLTPAHSIRAFWEKRKPKTMPDDYLPLTLPPSVCSATEKEGGGVELLGQLCSICHFHNGRIVRQVGACLCRDISRITRRKRRYTRAAAEGAGR